MSDFNSALRQAIECHQRGAVDEAALLYQVVLCIEPHNTSALQNLAQIEASRGNDTAAASLFCQALDLAQDDVVLLNNYASFLRERHEQSLAIETLERALIIAPRAPLTLLNLSFALAERGDTVRAVAYLNDVLKMDPTCVPAHTFLGKMAALDGRRADAIAHFSNALRFAPGGVEPRLLRAAMLFECGSLDEAAEDFRRVLEIEPGHATATYALGAMGQVTAPTRAPSDYVRDLFDAYAETFDHHLVEVLGYRTPKILYDQFHRYVDRQSPMEVLDLGCGTGLMGALFHENGIEIDGVDLSMEMIKKAKEKGFYRDLCCGDVLDYMHSTRKCYHLVLACDVLVYVGDLAPFFKGLATVVEEAGFVSLSIEDALAADYELKQSRRYGHSLGYVTEMASRVGFKLVSSEKVILRQDGCASVAGNAILLRKSK